MDVMRKVIDKCLCNFVENKKINSLCFLPLVKLRILGKDCSFPFMFGSILSMWSFLGNYVWARV